MRHYTFTVTITNEDLEFHGYDPSKVTDQEFEAIAELTEENIHEEAFYDCFEAALKSLNLQAQKMFIIQFENIPSGKNTPRLCGFHGKKGFTIEQSEAIKYKTKKRAEASAQANLPEGFRYKISSI